jgi:hypothetical protein
LAKRPFAKDFERGAETSAGEALEDSAISKKKNSLSRRGSEEKLGMPLDLVHD